jgi:hypothetical protein
MKRVVILSLFLSLLWSTAAVCAEPSFITSDTLTLEDVKKTVVNHVKSMGKDGSLKEILGIYENDTKKNNIEVFWVGVIDGKTEQNSTTVIRFRSGKWFNLDIGEILTK